MPRTVGEAEAMRDTPKARALTAPDGVEAVRGQGTGRDVIACGGRARMQLYEPIGRPDAQEVEQLSVVCGVLMQCGYRS